MRPLYHRGQLGTTIQIFVRQETVLLERITSVHVIKNEWMLTHH